MTATIPEPAAVVRALHRSGGVDSGDKRPTKRDTPRPPRLDSLVRDAVARAASPVGFAVLHGPTGSRLGWAGPDELRDDHVWARLTRFLGRQHEPIVVGDLGVRSPLPGSICADLDALGLHALAGVSRSTRAGRLILAVLDRTPRHFDAALAAALDDLVGRAGG